MAKQQSEFNLHEIGRALSRAWIWIAISTFVGGAGFAGLRSNKESLNTITAIIYSTRSSDAISSIAQSTTDPKITITMPGVKFHRVEVKTKKEDAILALYSWLAEANSSLVKLEGDNLFDVEQVIAEYKSVLEACRISKSTDIGVRHLCAVSASELNRLKELKKEKQIPFRVLSVANNHTQLVNSVVRDVLFGAFVGAFLSVAAIGSLAQWRHHTSE